jgi:hypothetical protein
VLPKDATNKYQESRRVELTTFWIVDDGRIDRDNSWQHDVTAPKDTWKKRSYVPKEIKLVQRLVGSVTNTFLFYSIGC